MQACFEGSVPLAKLALKYSANVNWSHKDAHNGVTPFVLLAAVSSTKSDEEKDDYYEVLQLMMDYRKRKAVSVIQIDDDENDEPVSKKQK